MRDLTAKYSQDVEAIWRPETQRNSETSLELSPISPFVDMKALSTPQTSLDLDESKSRMRRSLPGGSHKDQKSPKDHGSGSDASDDADDELFQRIDMAALDNIATNIENRIDAPENTARILPRSGDLHDEMD
ncbi:hypothetical protein ACO1O0_001869 [Amphichorda felina]